MPDLADGTAELINGRTVLRFERRFAHPIERVWDALTQPQRLVRWVGAAEVEIELVEGGNLVSRAPSSGELADAIADVHGSVPQETHDTVLRVEPQRLLEHTFGGDHASTVRWELEPDGDGCILRLTHHEPPEFRVPDAPRDLAGWHELLESLAAVLDDREATWSRDRWEEARDRYAAAMRDARGDTR